MEIAEESEGRMLGCWSSQTRLNFLILYSTFETNVPMLTLNALLLV
jgi:hypothetical protein